VMHTEIQGLLALVDHEVDELREIISSMRSGEPRGDNALVPAVRRQVRRFGVLFGIQVHLDTPDEIHTTRALAGALFHMVNEALNNVRKHTSAREAWVTLDADEASIVLAVQDNAGTLQGRPVEDFVPRSLSERAKELGGTLVVTRPNAMDTRLVITIPI